MIAQVIFGLAALLLILGLVQLVWKLAVLLLRQWWRLLRGIVLVLWLLFTAPGWLCVALLFGTLDLLSLWNSSKGAHVEPVPHWVRTDSSQQPVGEESGVAETRRVPVTAHLCARPRRRARWVKAIESVLGDAPGGVVGKLVRGRWTPDLPSEAFSPELNLLLSKAKGGVRILGGGSVVGKSGDDEEKVPYFVVEHPDGTVETCFPQLISSLSSYTFFRKRESTLVLALRSRALDWCKRKGLSSSSTEVAVSTAIRWAWHVGDLELYGRHNMEEEDAGPWWG